MDDSEAAKTADRDIGTDVRQGTPGKTCGCPLYHKRSAISMANPSSNSSLVISSQIIGRLFLNLSH